MHPRPAHLILTLALAVEGAQAATPAADHPLVSRFPGAEIASSEVKAFDAVSLPVGLVRRADVTPARPDAVPSKSIRVEGKLTRLVYTNPAGRSSLEIFRSYQDGLAKAGFQPLFTCSGTECAEAGTNDDIATLGRWCAGGLDCDEPMRYVAAKLPRPEGDVYVAVKVLINGFSTGRTILAVVEARPMEADLVTVKSADVMKTDIGSTGHTPVYGIYFDTGKADVKPDSAATIEEIAKLLRSDPALKLHVVGHTDNVGALAFNMALSKQRADAVVAELVRKHGIGAGRLDSAGVGSLSPVTTNRTEAGRAKNRRVELVEQ